MSTHRKQNVLLIVLAISIALLSGRIILTHVDKNADTGNKGGQREMGKLPDDVDTVMEGYRFSSTVGDIQVSVRGRRIVRRGRQVLGLRSNLVKTNFYEDVAGTLRAKKGTLSFSSSAAEWNSRVSQPLILKKNVFLIVNGKRLSKVKSARIHCEQALLEVDSGKTEMYHLK